MLDKQQVDQFRQEGYLVVEDAFTAGSIAALREAAAEIVADFDVDRHRTVFTTTDRDAGRDDYFFDSAEKVHCFLEEGALDAEGTLTCPRELAINKIGHAMHDLVPGFTSFCRQDMIGQALRDLGYEDPLLWQTMYIFKQPRIGGEVRWHQDASYLISEPQGVTGMWVALEDATRSNGCLWMSPGGHRRPLSEIYEVDWAARKGTLRDLEAVPWPSSEEAVAVEVPAGSLVIFNDHMPHYSSQNTSGRSRHAFTMHFSDASSAWPEKNWLQRPKLGAFRVA
jgi:phytanoyl-CoA hydroxylase